VADEGTIAPDSRRLARAHRAGLRPTSPWLLTGALCLALAVGLRWSGPAVWSAWQGLWVGGLAPRAMGAELVAFGGALMRALGGAAALVVAAMVLGGRLGWVDRYAGRGLAVGSQRSWMRGALAVLVPVLAAVLVAGVCAGAARSVDASEVGLLALWWAWLLRVLVGVGSLLVVAGMVDRALARRRLWRALHRSAGDLRRGGA